VLPGVAGVVRRPPKRRLCDERGGFTKGGPRQGLLGQVKSRKLKYFGHTTRHESLEKDIVLGIMTGKRRQGGQKKQWIDDIVQWGDRSLV